MPQGWCRRFSMRKRLKCRTSSARWPIIARGPIRCCEKRTTRRRRTPRQKLHASLALLPVDASASRLPLRSAARCRTARSSGIRDALAPHKDALLDKLWAVALTPDKGKESQRLRAAAALAKYDPESERWAKVEWSGRGQSGRGRTRSSWVTGWRRFRPDQGKAAGAAETHLSRPPIGGKSERTWPRTSWPTTPPTSHKCWPTC